MSTFGEMTTAISRRLMNENGTAVTLPEIREAINDEVDFWKHKRFWFNTSSADLSIAADDTAVTLPDDFLIDLPRNAFTITDSNLRFAVMKVNTARFDDLLNTSVAGRPEFYCNRNGALQFAPYADRDYTGKLNYIKDYARFVTADDSADNTTNDFLTEAKSLIQNGALARIFGELRHDADREMYYRGKAGMDYANLLSRTNARIRTGTLTVEQ